MPEDNEKLMTAEEMMEHVTECIRKGLEPPTRDRIRRAREGLLAQADEAMAVQLENMDHFNVIVNKAELLMDVQFRYNVDLKVWEFVELSQSSEITLPHPIKFVRFKFNANKELVATVDK